MATEIQASYIEMDLDTEDFKGMKYNKTSFNKGIKDVSYLAAMITGLLNTGLEKQQVSEIACCIVKNGLIKAE